MNTCMEFIYIYICLDPFLLVLVPFDSLVCSGYAWIFVFVDHLPLFNWSHLVTSFLVKSCAPLVCVSASILAPCVTPGLILMLFFPVSSTCSLFRFCSFYLLPNTFPVVCFCKAFQLYLNKACFLLRLVLVVYPWGLMNA